jgi:hypothetical protein
MNTPAHLAASVLVWRSQHGWRPAAAIAFGAVLPDLPMFGFYAYQKWIGRPEGEIWSELYFQDEWQLFFDLFNSIPLAGIVIVISYFFGFQWGVLCAASALLHMACDFPLHHDDAHRHFLPLSNWRFSSPFSYWDPKHYGHYFMWCELIFVIGASTFVGWKGDHLAIRSVAFTTLAFYLVGFTFALVVWLPQLAKPT